MPYGDQAGAERLLRALVRGGLDRGALVPAAAWRSSSIALDGRPVRVTGELPTARTVAGMLG